MFTDCIFKPLFFKSNLFSKINSENSLLLRRSIVLSIVIVKFFVESIKSFDLSKMIILVLSFIFSKFELFEVVSLF
jgi:hypothetical protein